MRGVVPKLCEGKPMTPAIGACVDEAAQISFQALTDSFGLVVRLGVVSRTHTQVCARVLEQLTPEVACENRVAIRDNGAREPVDPVDARHAEECHLSRCVRVS